MSKMLKNIIIMAVVLILLVVGVIFVPKLKKKPVEIEITPTPEYIETTFSDYDSSEVNEVILESNGETTILFYDASDELYKIRGFEDVKIDQTKAKSVIRTASYVQAEDIIREDLDNLVDFGLESPSAKVTASYTDGKTNIFYYGNKAPGSGTYYMMMEGVDKVLNVWNNYGTNAQYNIYSLMQIEKRAIDIASTKTVRLYKDGDIHLEFTNVPSEESIRMGGWALSIPYEKGLHTNEDGKSFYKLMELIQTIEPNEIVANDTDLAKYKLNNPWGEVELISKFDQTTLILFGEDNDGAFVMKYGDSDIVYSISESKLSIFEYEAVDVIERLLSLINVKNVTSINMSGILGNNTIIINHEKRLDNDGKVKLDTNGDVIYDIVYVIENTQLTEDEKEQGSWFYQALLYPKIVREVTDMDYLPSNIIGVLEYSFEIEPLTYRMEFYEYDEYFYAYKIQDNEVFLLVNKKDIDIIPKYYEMLINREMVDPYSH